MITSLKLLATHFGVAVCDISVLNDVKNGGTADVKKRKGKAKKKGDVDAAAAETEENGATLAASLNRKVLKLFGTFVSEDGASVDYVGMANSDDFQELVEELKQLRAIKLDALSRDEKMAFWINLYNVLECHSTIHARRINPSGLPNDHKLIKQYCVYSVAGCYFSLGDIEHGVLRENSAPPYALMRNFSAADGRQQFVIRPMDCRIHCALNCGAQSCPPVRVYKPETLDDSLTRASQWFCSSDENVRIHSDERIVELSEIFKWYLGDFVRCEYGDKKSAHLGFVVEHLDEEDERKEVLSAWLDEIDTKAIQIRWIPYNWSINEAQSPVEAGEKGTTTTNATADD